MTLKRFAFNTGIKTFQLTRKLLGNRMYAILLSEFIEQVTPIQTKSTDIGDIQFYCPGRLPQWRGETLLDKEPETIEWIRGFEPNSVFWDIGANVGVFSLYAARKRNIQVLAFEPSAFNYYILVKNIEINQMDSDILALCLAFNDQIELRVLNMADTQLGGALHAFGSPQDSFNVSETTNQVVFKQGMIGISIDEFIEMFSPAFPNHIKIDVDGIEDKIIEGASNTLSDSRIKSVLVELDTNDIDYCQRVTKILEKAGLALAMKKRSPFVENGPFASVYNHIYVRN